MTIEEAKVKLASLRNRQKKLRRQIDSLRQFVFERGENPDRPEIILAERNRIIYQQHKNGLTYSALAARHHLSATRIRGICIRIEYLIQNKKQDYRFYQEKRTAQSSPSSAKE